jgi:hypothetical protein
MKTKAFKNSVLLFIWLVFFSRQCKGILSIYVRDYTNLTGILSDYWRMKSTCSMTGLISVQIFKLDIYLK